MAERLADIVSQIGNVRQLEAVVGAMRGIAASRALQSRSMAASIRAHASVVSEAIGHALSLLPPVESSAVPVDSQRTIAILFCAEHGFAGAFSEHVLDAAGTLTADTIVFLVGTRGRNVAGERGIAPAWSGAHASHAAAIPAFANRLTDVLYDRVADGAVTRAEIYYSTSKPGRISVTRRMLLPVDIASFVRGNPNEPPLVTLPPEVLLERLTAEYVYVQLCEAAMSSFAAENEARMLAMTAAKTNIDRKSEGLKRRERQLRQEETTNEVVELAAGAEAQARSARRPGP